MSYSIRTFQQACNRRDDEFLSLAPTPYNEDCLQAGSKRSWCILECSTYIEQLIRKYGECPDNCEFFIMENYHEAGIYYEAAIFYKNENEVAQNYALQLERGDSLWDNVSLEKLSMSSHPYYQASSLINC